MEKKMEKEMEKELMYSECRDGEIYPGVEDEEFRYRELANAVVMQAAQDLFRALRKQKRRNTAENRKEVKELESFFRSGWYRLLTGKDGEEMIARIRESALKGYEPKRCSA